jgi:hypothetical protein
MINLHQLDDSFESQSALALERLILDHLPKAKIIHNLHIDIIPSVQCYGEKTQDVDLVVFLIDHRSPESLFQSLPGTKIRSLCLTVEVKKHSASGISFKGPKCYVEYRGKPHNVSDQSEKQKYSLSSYIRKNSINGHSPWVTNVIWLRDLPKSELPKAASNILGSDASWQDFLDKISFLNGEKKHAPLLAFNSDGMYREILRTLTFEMEPSKIDRKRMEAITKEIISKETQYFKKMGQQLLIFRGRGGTGKTMRLLNIAHKMYSKYGYRVLILTYNKALVADLKRLLALLKIRNSIAGKSIYIKSIYSFMYAWLVALGVMKKGADDFIINYAKYKAVARDYLKEDAIQQADINTAIADNSKELEWDLIIVDEAQDWPEDERDILYSIYGYRKVILADGVDQFVRSGEFINWRINEARNKSQIVPLTKSLRLKQNICNTVEHFADQIGYSDWDLKAEPSAFGGKVIVFIGDMITKDINDKLLRENQKDGNSNIDVLYCVPPGWVNTTKDGGRESYIAQQLIDWGLDVWDGVDEDRREDYPTSLSQLRIVQYDSCRGLEGWTVIACGFDEFYLYKEQIFREESIEKDLFFDPDEAAGEYAKRWLMIPLTRAINTLFLHIKDKNSYVGNILRSLHEKYPEDIEWIDE